MNTKETIEQLNALIDKASKVRDELKSLTPEFKEGEWLSYIDYAFNLIFRFKASNISCVEGYEIYGTDMGKLLLYPKYIDTFPISGVTSATESQKLEILSKVAISKGLVEGVKFESACLGSQSVIQGEFTIGQAGCLFCNELMIYNNHTRKWAEPIKEPEISINSKPVTFNQIETTAEIYGFEPMTILKLKAIVLLIETEALQVKDIRNDYALTKKDISALKEIIKIMENENN